MQSEALAKKAADAVGVTPYSDMRPFVEQAVKWALNEAALSTDADPDGWICEDEFTLEPDKAWEWEDRGLSTKPFYFSPQQNSEPAKTAPAVAVKHEGLVERLLIIGSMCDDQEIARTAYDAVIALSAQVKDVAGWQPINTAPQDGDKFLFIEESGRIQVGRMDSEWGEEKSVFVCLTGGARDWYPSVKPTHWMPLPASPTSKHGDAE